MQYIVCSMQNSVFVQRRARRTVCRAPTPAAAAPAPSPGRTAQTCAAGRPGGSRPAAPVVVCVVCVIVLVGRTHRERQKGEDKIHYNATVSSSKTKQKDTAQRLRTKKNKKRIKKDKKRITQCQDRSKMLSNN
jgi:hypothetical protein